MHLGHISHATGEPEVKYVNIFTEKTKLFLSFFLANHSTNMLFNDLASTVV